MSLALGNGITATWTPNGGTLVTFGVTGFSWSGGDRPEIDVTIGTSNRRETYIGLASPEEYTLSVKYNSADTALTSSMENCGAGALIVKMAPDDNCGTIETLLTMTDADLVSFNYSVELDGILEGEATFRRRH
jgi:hypothetical protein